MTAGSAGIYEYYLSVSSGSSSVKSMSVVLTVHSSPTTTVTTTSTTTTTTLTIDTTSVPTTTVPPFLKASTSFTESNLPNGAKFTVVYDGITNSSTVGTKGAGVTFSTPHGSYQYMVPNVIYGGRLYYIHAQTGSITAGNRVTVSYSSTNVPATTSNTLYYLTISYSCGNVGGAGQLPGVAPALSCP